MFSLIAFHVAAQVDDGGLLRDLTSKAVYLPKPRVPINVSLPTNRKVDVKVRVVITTSTLRVTEAKSVNGPRSFAPYAEQAAKCAEFTALESDREYIIGFLLVSFDEESKVTMGEINGGVINGRAIDLPKPETPKNTDAYGTVSVRVQVDEMGNVISAKAVSGSICLGRAAVDAAMKAKFLPVTYGGKPIRISGLIVYPFPPRSN